MRISIFLIFLFICSPSWATTWHIRTDGSTGTNCTGTTNAAYPGSGTNQACALNSLYWVLPATGQSSSKAMAGGDTVIIHGSDDGGTGSYRIGCQNSSTCADSTINLVRGGSCNEFQSYDCVMGTIPSGTSGAHTKIIGCSSTGCGCTTSWVSGALSTTCTSHLPELWGAGRIGQILNITGQSYIDLQDIEITDHATCGEGHPTLNCGSGNQPTLLTAQDGIRALSSSDITFTGLYIHGLWREGIYGGSVGNHTYTGTRIEFNSKAGQDTDSCGNDGSCGVSNGKYMTYSYTAIRRNGCVENSASLGNAATNGCYDQNNGGYGDGLGATSTSGTWTFTDCDVSYNFSDGLDLLYLNRSGTSGGTLTVKRSKFEANIGNPFKSDANVYAEDNYIIGNCPYWVGKSYTLSGTSICRALGNSVTVAWNANTGAGIQPKFYNNTITGNGDVMFSTTGTCTASTPFLVKNNLLLGGTDYNGGDGVSIFYNSDGTCSATFTEDYNTCSNNFKEASPCPASHSFNNVAPTSTYSGTVTQGSPYFTSDNYINNLSLKAGSTAIGAAITSLSGQDALGFNNQDRGAAWDMGALDQTAGSSPTCGDGTVASPETCDDGGTTSGDGCSSTCTTETGYSCTGNPSVCTTTCGDGIKAGSEACDDGNGSSGDGCSSSCVVENGYSCTGTAPSVCTGSAGTGNSSRMSGKVTLSGKVVLR